MLDHSILDISLYQIKLFLLLAEEQNFSRVAALSNMTQPTLSRRISQLEQTINMKLFNRKDRPVTLTPEGRKLYEGWKNIQKLFDDALCEAEKIGANDMETLYLSFIESGNNRLSIPSFASWFRERIPELDINLRYINFSDWRSKLLSGEIDLIQTVLFETIDLDEAFTWEQITSCPKEVVMLSSNPLAQKDKITFTDLRDQSFIVISSLESPQYYRYIRNLCLEHGFEPNVGLHISSADNLISSLSKNNEVLICDQYLRDHNNPMLKHFPLPDTLSGIVTIWKKDNTKTAILKVIESIKEYMNNFPSTI